VGPHDPAAHFRGQWWHPECADTPVPVPVPVPDLSADGDSARDGPGPPATGPRFKFAEIGDRPSPGSPAAGPPFLQVAPRGRPPFTGIRDAALSPSPTCPAGIGARVPPPPPIPRSRGTPRWLGGPPGAVRALSGGVRCRDVTVYHDGVRSGLGGLNRIRHKPTLGSLRRPASQEVRSGAISDWDGPFPADPGSWLCAQLAGTSTLTGGTSKAGMW
jgi:hypothetical protein